MLTEKTFDNGSLLINYAEGPASGVPLVLLHGLPSRWQEFQILIPALTEKWHVYALDARGQGKSGRTPGHYYSQYYADDVISFLEFLGEPACLFGMSAGGGTGLAVGARLPDYIRALIVGDSPIDFTWLFAAMGSPQMRHIFSVWQEVAAMDLPVDDLAEVLADKLVYASDGKSMIRYIDRSGSDMTQMREEAEIYHDLDPAVLDYHVAGKLSEFLNNYDVQTILTQITCPLLLLQADPEWGSMLTEWVVDLVLSSVPTATHVILDDVGHDLGLSSGNVAQLINVISDFLLRPMI